MELERNGLSLKLIDWVMTAFGIITAGLLLGSFGYAWSIDKEQSVEKKEWRQQHQTDHRRELEELKKDIKDVQQQAKEEIKDNQKEIKELLLEVIKINRQKQPK